MVKVEIAEAQAMLLALLQQVEQGKQFVITREGSPIAWLVPDALRPSMFTEAQRTKAQAAVERIGERAKTLPIQPFNWEDIKADRDLGRR